MPYQLKYKLDSLQNTKLGCVRVPWSKRARRARASVCGVARGVNAIVMHMAAVRAKPHTQCIIFHIL